MRCSAKGGAVFWLAVLWVLAGGASAAPADPDHEALQALDSLKKKMEWEASQLKRLSEMVRVPSGRFSMGAEGADPHEAPAHEVVVDTFEIDKYEVTQLQYLSVVGKNPSYFKKCLLCPVEKVEFDEAEAFCQRIGKRLPTEAEWERAARAGRTGPYHWGRDLVDLYAWYGNNAGGQSRPVGTRNPNPLGLQDMAGNVWEWVADWYDPNYYRNSPPRNPRGPKAGTAKVVRGGAWGDPPEFLTHSYRGHREPQTRYINVGFRCARDPS